MYTCTHTYTHTYTQIHICIHTHTNIFASQLFLQALFNLTCYFLVGYSWELARDTNGGWWYPLHVLKHHQINLHSFATTHDVCHLCMMNFQAISSHVREKFLFTKDFPHLRSHVGTVQWQAPSRWSACFYRSLQIKPLPAAASPAYTVEQQEHLKIQWSANMPHVRRDYHSFKNTKPVLKKNYWSSSSSGDLLLSKFTEAHACLNCIQWHYQFPSKKGSGMGRGRQSALFALGMTTGSLWPK